MWARHSGWLVFLAACSPAPITELAVVVRSELPMDHVTIHVTNPEGEVKVDARIDAPAFPLTAVLVRDHPPYGPVNVEVVGYGVGTIDREASTSFVEGKRVELELVLEAACRCQPRCGPGMTCVGGACASDAVDPSSLPVYVPPDGGMPSLEGGVHEAGESDAGAHDGGPVDGGPIDAGALDAGHDAGMPDAGHADAGALDAGSVDAGHDGGSVDASSPDAGHDAAVDLGGAVDAGSATLGCGCQEEACCASSDCAPGLSCRMGSCLSCAPTMPSLIGAYGGAIVQSVTGSGGTIDLAGALIGSPGMTLRGSIALSGGVTASGSAVTATHFLTVTGAGDTITFTDSTGASSSLHLTGATASGSVTFAAAAMNAGLSSVQAPAPSGTGLRLADAALTSGDILIAVGELCR